MILRSFRGKWRCLRLFILVCIIVCLIFGLHLLGTVDSGFNLKKITAGGTNLTNRRQNNNSLKKVPLQMLDHPRNIFPALVRRQDKLKTQIKNINKTISKMDILATKAKQPVFKSELEVKLDSLASDGAPPCYEVHTFYYPWYANEDHDGAYYHWNHEYLQHWNQKEAAKWPQGRHKPPTDVGSNYYPSLGAYSSSNPQVVDVHMQMMRYARIGVVVVSWYPPGDADNEGKQPDALMPLILDMAQKYDLKVAFHIEPYKGRDQHTMKKNLKYIIDTYGTHPAFYRTSFRDKKNRPLLYIYDSYLVSSSKWAEIFTSPGSQSVRDTELDAIFIGLVVESKHKDELFKAGFDGYFTYFATNGFTFGSTWQHWKELSEFAKKKDLLFIPSIGPGYIDTEVRPWNAMNTRKRLNGKYYQESFSSAMEVSPKIISITSFNEWHEGTQIEPAVKMAASGRSYLDYGKNGPNFYLNLTRNWVDKFSPTSPDT